MLPATTSPGSAWHGGSFRTEASLAPLLTRNAALSGCWPGDCDSMAAPAGSSTSAAAWTNLTSASGPSLICVERCNWSARCVSCARPWFAPFQLRLIHAASPAVECAPSLFPTSQFLAGRDWSKLAPWLAAGPSIAPDKLQAAPSWGSALAIVTSPTGGRLPRLVTCILSAIELRLGAALDVV